MKEKEKEERNRQRRGEEPVDASVKQKFLQGMETEQDVVVRTTSSGSMTQEIFFEYAKHFVNHLPPKHDPVILFLDGHGSRWSTPALKHLVDNKVFPFFIGSHTSIWAQPNDVGVNLRFHSCVEEVTKANRRGRETTSMSYFNTNFCFGYSGFVDKERTELLTIGSNSTTDAFLRTGLYPFNPFCEAWTQAIGTLGLREEKIDNISYEIYPRENMPILKEEDKKLLREGINFGTIDELNDVFIAQIRCREILRKWRDFIKEGVRKGNNKRKYQETNSPENVLLTPPQKLALTMLQFKKVDITRLCHCKKN